jgi:hypothetical protein
MEHQRIDICPLALLLVIKDDGIRAVHTSIDSPQATCQATDRRSGRPLYHCTDSYGHVMLDSPY